MMKPTEFLGLAIFAAIQSALLDSAVCALVAWVMFALWLVASFKSFKRQQAGEALS